MNDKENTVQSIVNQKADVEYRSFAYEGLPPAENVMPLVKYPEHTVLTEKIGNTEYTVNAHFNENGRDLLCCLSQLIEKGVQPNVFFEE